MRRPARWVAIACACAAAGCASSSKTQAYWVRRDGVAPDPTAVREARAQCERHATDVASQRTRRYLNIEWAAAMRECMEEHGYVLITGPGE